LKFIDKSRSLKYTLLFALVFVFSFLSAYCLTGLIKSPPALEKVPISNHRQLLENYHFLNYFLTPVAPYSLSAIEPDEMNNPLLAAIGSLRQARLLNIEKKFALSDAILVKISGQFPYITAKRDELQLENLYAENNYKTFVAYYDTHTAKSREIRILLLNSLLKNNQGTRAREEFKDLFKKSNLSVFAKTISRPALLALLKGLDEAFWFAKFSFLLETNAKVEFRLELPYCPDRSLVRLFKAEFAYQSHQYAQAQKILRGGLGEKYQPSAEKILLKIGLRLDPQADILGRLQAITENSGLYPELLLDAAQILVGRDEFQKALSLYTLYLEQSRGQNEEYWKTVWLVAWINYRLGRKNLALKYFQMGSESPLLSYQIASRYWQSKLEKKRQQLDLYPFSYYTVRALGDKSQFEGRHQAFTNSIAAAPSARFHEIIADLKLLAKYGLWDDCLETIQAAKSDLQLNPSDLNLLKIIESLIYIRQNQFSRAFAKFRGNFQTVESVHLPVFLSGIFFPRQYTELITAYSQEQSVDPFLVQALIREESFFQPDSLSPANAYGLMQLLPGTAREIARGSKLKFKARDLFNPELNIRLGLQHLKSLLDKYDGRLYLALAAYNAGAHRVDQWLAEFPEADEEEFIEMIPFTETRTYVKNILRNYFFYRYYYEKS
jgi:soluble lytic murein transglycosylase-like protein